MMIEFKNIINVSDEIKELIRTWRNSKHVSQYMITNHHISKEEHKRWIEELTTCTITKAWVILYDKKPIGLASLSNIDSIKRTVEWGFYIADVPARGKGVGSAVLYQLIEYVFNTLNFRIMNTTVLENNPIALKMYEKFGFKKDAKPPRYIQRDGKKLAVFNVSITKKQWKKVKESTHLASHSNVHLIQ